MQYVRLQIKINKLTALVHKKYLFLAQSATLPALMIKIYSQTSRAE
jgi:hypothetical protein